MTEKFDPYHKWLGIPAEEQPPNHYRLLTIALFEEDADVISYAADRQMAHLRTFQSGAHSAESQRLLNEISAARKCLLSPTEKSAYDQQLRAQQQAKQAQAAKESQSAAGSSSKIIRERRTAPSSGGSGISVASKSGVKNQPASKSAIKKQSPQPRQRTEEVAPEFDIVTDVQSAGSSGSAVNRGSGKSAAAPAMSIAAGRRKHGPREGRKAKPPVWLFAGAVLVMALIAAVGIVLSGKKPEAAGSAENNENKSTNKLAKNGLKENPANLPALNLTPPSTEEADSKTPDAAPASTLLTTVNLLDRIDPQTDALQGTWQRSGRELIAPAGDFVRLEIPFSLSSSYVVTLVASWTESNAALRVGLPIEDRQVMFKIDQENDMKAAGFEQIDGKSWEQNSAFQRGTFLNTPGPNIIQCTVRPGEVRAYCNGREIAKWSGRASQLSLPDKWATRDRRHAFVGSWRSGFRLQRLEIGPLTPSFKPESAGTLPSLAKPTETALSEETLAANFERGEETDLLQLIDPQREVGAGIWKKEGGALISPSMPHAKLQVPVKLPARYEILLVAQRLTGLDSLKVGINVGGTPITVLLDGYQGTSSGLDLIDGKRMRENETAYSGAVLAGRGTHEIVCSVTENSVRVTSNGKQIIAWQGDPKRFSLEPGARWPDTTMLCLGSYQSTFRISRLVLRPLSAVTTVASTSRTPTEDPLFDSPATTPAKSSSELPAGARLPIPDTSAIEALLGQIKAEHADLYAGASRLEGKLPLAEKLLEQATTRQVDPALQYVLLTEVSTHAADAAEAKLARDACRILAERFEVDGLALQAAALTASVRGIKTNSQRHDLTMESIAAQTEAVAQDHYPAAVEFANAAFTASSKSDDLELKKLARAHRDHVKLLQTAWEKVAAAAKTLAENPKDAAASTEVGKFRCFWAADWQRGLPLLVQGSDPVLRSIAANDLKDPDKTADQIRLGDDWWEYGEKQTMPARLIVFDRAALWYNVGLKEDVTGVQRTKIESRLDKFTTLRDGAGPLFARAAHPEDAVLFGKHWYKVFDERLTWDEAKVECEKLGGYLVCIESPEENLFVKTLAIGDDGNPRRRIPYWLGASDTEQERVFRWVNGSQSVYADWKPGEPNNANGEEHYVGILLSGFGFDPIAPERMLWNDYKGHERFPYVCEWER